MTDVFEEQRLLINERRKTIVQSATAVHIDYYSPHLENSDLDEFERELKAVGLEISSFNKSGIVYASLEDYMNLARVVVNHEVTRAIVLGAAGNLFWEGIKGVTQRAWHRLKGRKLSQAGEKPKELTFGLDFKIDPNTGVAFRLDATIPTEDIDRVLDKTIELVRTIKPNAHYEHPLFGYYDIASQRWVVLNPIEEMRRERMSNTPPSVKRKVSKPKTGREKKRDTRAK